MVGKRLVLGLAGACWLALATGAALGAEGGEPARRRGPFNRERFRQMMLDRIKDTLQVSDDEWTVVKPRLEAVMTLSRDAGGGAGMRGLFRRRRRQEPPPPDQPERETTATQKAQQELEKTLENKDAKPEEIRAKLTALREAREKAKEELAKAKNALKEVLTQRQEAQLVLYGMLD